MLSVLRIKNLAIIDELEVELTPGLNVITGETGAGKSILIGALGLVLGHKGRSELVRTGAERAEVEALFELGEDQEARARLAASGIDGGADGELIIRRVLNKSGRTRAYVNGTLTTARQLAELARGLVDVSSQHEHHTLVDPATHMRFLDEFGQLGDLSARVSEVHRGLREAEDALARARAASLERGEREDFLRFQIKEINDLDPSPGEDSALERERSRLMHAERLVDSAGGAEVELYSSDDAICARLDRVAKLIREGADLDPTLAPHAEAVEGALAQLEDTARELSAYAQDVHIDPARLREVDDRHHRLRGLMKKFGGDVDGVLARRDELSAELEQLAGVEATIEALSKERDMALRRATKEARKLSKARRKIAKKLGDAIGGELATLGMGGAKVEVQVQPLAERRGELSIDGARLTETGIDRVEFLIAPNRGEAPRPLRKIASGGELSRALLAVKRVLSGVGRAGLYVFDEVDSGVGGAIAEVIGQKLTEVAAHHQVICVTHLAQIAVYGEAHYRVTKRVAEGRTESGIERLDEGERLDEVARMVGGIEVTKSTRHAAREMLQLAGERRAR
ncbi:MAG TPA: DNA repair protein RecN [Polyangiaceae bacterium]|nr:DNA repair protein RecN [Polyangiaceae bacterium]